MSISKKQLFVRTIIVGAVLYATATIFYNVGYNQSHTGVNTQNGPDVETLWLQTNAERVKRGIPPLQLDPYLEKSATEKCADMATNNYFEHTSPSGEKFQDFIADFVSHPTSRYLGENLSFGYDTSTKVTNAWMLSPHHRENMLNTKYVAVGYAVCTNSNANILVVQHFESN